MPITVDVQGLRELKAALDALPKSTSRGVQRRVLLKRAQPIVAAMKAKAPVDTGKLRASIHATTKRPRGHKTPAAVAFARTRAMGGSIADARAAAKAAGSAPMEVFIGPDRAAWYAHFAEFGTSHSAPHPFIRPAFDQHKKALLDGIADDIWAEIKKTAERAAKRKARAGR